MAQAASSIVDVWTKFFAEGGNIGSMVTALAELTASDVKYQVVGQPGEFALAANLEGIDAMMNFVTTTLAPAFLSILDPPSPSLTRPLAWLATPSSASVFLRAKEVGITLERTPFSMDAVMVFKTNEAGKFSVIRAYFDALHIQKAMKTQ